MSTDASGSIISQARFTMFGEELTWEGSGDSPTDFSFTGQRRDGFGLMDYNARFYSSSLGRFISPDTLIPGAGNPMAWDRFSYVMNNPLNNIDPTGHISCRDENIPIEDCGGGDDENSPEPTIHIDDLPPLKKVDWIAKVEYVFGITLINGSNDWTQANAELVFRYLQTINSFLGGDLKEIIFGATFTLQDYTGDKSFSGFTEGRAITFYTKGEAALDQINFFHEFGHMLNSLPGRMDDYFSGKLDSLDKPSFINQEGDNKGYLNKSALINPTGTVQASNDGVKEQWADVFANYMAGNINLDTSQGREMYNFISNVLAPYNGVP